MIDEILVQIPQIKTSGLDFNLLPIDSFQIHCGSSRRRNDFQIFMQLTSKCHVCTRKQCSEYMIQYIQLYSFGSDPSISMHCAF